MARAALPGRLTWQPATVLGLVTETERTESMAFDVPHRTGHRAGQHVEVRLTAEDGYQAQRSYSIASGPEDEHVVLTIERLVDGEVSPYLTNGLLIGSAIELRGPIGGYFVWEASVGGPVLLVAGGSGVVPFRAMLRHHAAAGSAAAVRLLYSSRSLAELIYRDELSRLDGAGVDVRLTLTREWPQDWSGHRGGVDRAMLDEVAWPPRERQLVYVCGPSGFVEAVASGLVENGHEPDRIRTERFGPSGT